MSQLFEVSLRLSPHQFLKSCYMTLTFNAIDMATFGLSDRCDKGVRDLFLLVQIYLSASMSPHTELKIFGVPTMQTNLLASYKNSKVMKNQGTQVK